VARESSIHFNYDAKMKRQKYNFPSPRGERSTQVYLSSDGVDLTPFLRVDRSSVSAPVFYQRTLPKKTKLEEDCRERQPLVIEHEPEVIEEMVITPEIFNEELKETKLETKLVVKLRDPKVKEIKPSLQLVEKVGETLEIPTSWDRVSVVMAFRGQGDGRLTSLKKCIKCLREQTVNCYIILVEQDVAPIHQEELEPLVDSYLFTYSREMFNKSWSFNCGVIIAPDNLILLHDCDLLTPKNYVKEAIKILGTKDLALPWIKILYLTEESSEKYPEGHLKISTTLTSNQAVGGSLLVRKDFYLRIGGMDERFEGWGAEDNAFYEKACKLGRVSRVSHVTGLTLLHHYHEPAQKWHHHSHINNMALWEYYHRSANDIVLTVKELGIIGNPLKYSDKEG
jgi:hypothetical protein